MHDPATTTRLLKRFATGDASAGEELASAVYDQLHLLARSHLRRGSGPLQATALVHEAWLKLIAQEDVEFQSRQTFYKLASRIMRSVLVDAHRSASAEKRGGGRRPITLVQWADTAQGSVDVMGLDDALTRLEEHDPELAQVVEMRFFGGLSHPDIGEALGMSLRTVERRWRLARAWLHGELSE